MKGKKVFVTGGAHGIGKAIVTAFYEKGAIVAFCDTHVGNGEAIAQSLPGVRFICTDVSDTQQLETAFSGLLKEWGDIDVVVNNTGIGMFADLTETPVEQFDHILRTNLRPVFITSRLLAIHRRGLSIPSSYGRIINMASTRYLQSEAGSEGYAASKGGIVSLTHALAMSLSELHITVNCISPGWIETGDYGQLKPSDHKQHPSGRVGRPEDIARACLFLASPDNDFINGQNIVIDGGMTKKMIYTD